MPITPRSPSSLASSRTGSEPASYHSARWGRARASTNVRTVSRIARSSSPMRRSVAKRPNGLSGLLLLLVMVMVYQPRTAARPGVGDNEPMTADVLRYAAFTDEGRGGNPAGVVLDAAGLTAEEMLGIAREVGYSETAF